MLGRTLKETSAISGSHTPKKTDKILEFDGHVQEKMSKLEQLLGKSRDATSLKDSYLKMLMNSNTELGLHH